MTYRVVQISLGLLVETMDDLRFDVQIRRMGICLVCFKWVGMLWGTQEARKRYLLMGDVDGRCCMGDD